MTHDPPPTSNVHPVPTLEKPRKDKEEKDTERDDMFCYNSALVTDGLFFFIWNRSVNNSGVIGKNIPLDLDVEHSNNYLKQAMKNLGPNLTEKAVSRICNSERSVRKIIQSMDKTLKQSSDPGKHSVLIWVI